MKKFLVGVIFLIPIVVVIALSATGSIIALTTPVNPEDMVIKNSDNVEITKEDIVKVDCEDFDKFIIIEVLPTITQDKSVTYERIAEAGDGEVQLERIGESNRYRITPITIGVTQLEIRATANINVYKVVTFYVSSDTVDTVEIYNSQGVKLGDDEYAICVGEKLYVDAFPTDALSDNGIQWESRDPNIVKVNGNGELTIVGKGTTAVRATVIDKDGNSVHAEAVINTDGAIVSSSKIYTSADITVDYLKDNYALDSAVEIEYLNDDCYKFSNGDNAVLVEVLKVEEDAWGILDLPSTMYTKNGGYYPIIGRLVSGEIIEGYAVSVSNEEIIRYEPITGILVPLKAGNALVSITYNGFTAEKEITVRENPLAFELELGSADQKLGIQLSRTFGQYWLDAEGNTTNKFSFGVTDKSNSFDLEWSVNDESLATVTKIENSQDVVIEFSDASRGQAVTVTATLKINNLLQERVKRSFTFNIREKKAVNVYTWAEFKRVYELNYHDIVMQADLAVDSTCGLRMDIYGNGFKIDASKMPALNNGDREWVLDPRLGGGGHFEWQADNSTNKPLVIEDVIAIGRDDYLENKDYELGFGQFSLIEAPIEIKYLQVSNFTDGLYFYNSNNVLIEGCIFGANKLDGIHLAYEPGSSTHSSLTVRNNIFKQTGGAAIQLVTSWFGQSVMDKPFNIDINIEGFMDVYNWKERDLFQSIFANSLVTMIGSDIVPSGLQDLLAETVGSVIDEFIQQPDYDHLFYTYNGVDYASFSIVGLGLIADANVGVIKDNSTNKMINLNIPLENDGGEPVTGALDSITSLLNMIPSISSGGKLHITNDCFLVCADFTNQEPEIKPGDPVPNSKELYAKLTSAMQ